MTHLRFSDELWRLGLAKAKDVETERRAWMEDRVTELIGAGVPRDEISIEFHPDCRIIVCVCGEPRFECRLPVSASAAAAASGMIG